MVFLTQAALERLKTLIAEHPEESVVRLKVQDMESRLVFTITLEEAAHPDDEVQESDGMTLAVEAHSVSRMDGITVDYTETDGFRFRHPEHEVQVKNLGPIYFN